MSTAIAIQHRDTILHRLAAGQRLSEIAPDLGVSPQAISKILTADPDYKAALETGFEVKLDNAERAIEDAAEQVDVSRARALWTAISWRAGVEVPARWGRVAEQAPAVVNVSITLGDLGGLLQRVVSEQNVVTPALVTTFAEDHTSDNQ